MICPYCDNPTKNNSLHLLYECKRCQCGFKVYNLYSKRISYDFIYAYVNHHEYRLDRNYETNKTFLWLIEFWPEGSSGECILELDQIIQVTPQTVKEKIRTLLTFS